MSYKIFREVKNRFPDIIQNFNERIKTYEDKFKTFQIRLLKNIVFIDDTVPTSVLEELTYRLKQETIGAGKYLVKSGYLADQIYLIVNGQFEVLIEKNSKETFIDTLYSGCTIGGYSIIGGDPHTISVRAKEDSVVFLLDIEVLEEVRE